MNDPCAASTALTHANLDVATLRRVKQNIEREVPRVFVGVHTLEEHRAWIMQVPQLDKYRGGTIVILPKGTDPREARMAFEDAGYRVEAYP